MKEKETLSLVDNLQLTHVIAGCNGVDPAQNHGTCLL